MEEQQISLFILIYNRLETWFKLFPYFAEFAELGDDYLMLYEHDRNYIDDALDQIAKLRLGRE